MRKGEKYGERQLLGPDERKKTVTLTDELTYKLNYICEESGMTISEVLRVALDTYFEHRYGADCPEFDEYIKCEQEAWRNFER